jgi:molybdopterin-guanine dinucleotide biosynthesis protein B
MKVFSVLGYTASGKTTTIEKIITELKKRRYTVGTVKDIHFEQFGIDTEGTNTHRHRVAGADLVTARGIHETDVLYDRRLSVYEIAKFYDTDFLILEGFYDANVPSIITADSYKDLDERLDGRSFAISGKIADTIDEYKGYPAISALQDVSMLVDLIVEKTFRLLPDFDPKCCQACGYTCKEMCGLIVSGEKKREDCVIDKSEIKLKIDDNEIKMVPFVQKLLENAIRGVVSELEGYERNASISVELGMSKALGTDNE